MQAGGERRKDGAVPDPQLRETPDQATGFKAQDFGVGFLLERESSLLPSYWTESTYSSS